MNKRAEIQKQAWKDWLPVGGALLAWLCVWSVMAGSYPLFPVDETRYLTVAWEMRQSGGWILPTLNHLPYSHKPPVLFWLINLMWTLFGTGIAQARIVSLLAVSAVAILTAALGNELLRDRHKAATAALFLLASPGFMIYGGMIMFDVLLTVFVLPALLCLWRAARTQSLKPWFGYGLFMGLAVLAKGPVALVHLLPVALIAPYTWARDVPGPQWYRRFGMAFLIALAVALAWAIPAALSGGDGYAKLIFWSQTAGRMVKSFDHGRPFWFYLPFAVVFCLPALLWPPLRKAGKERLENLLKENETKFLLSWVGPAFLIFCLISGKQAHYILPLLPGAAIFAVGLASGQAVRSRNIVPVAGLYALIFFLLWAAPSIAEHIQSGDRVFREGFKAFNPIVTLCGLVAMASFCSAGYASPKRQLLFMVFSTAVLVSTVALQASQKILSFYDLRPLAAALQPYKSSPLAFAGEFDGEFGFLARLDKPVENVERGSLKRWFMDHPGGAAVIRYKNVEELSAYRLVFTQPYRANRYFALVVSADRQLPSD